ncbi:unnamed protein product [Effrenium voratum]|nr:unnamed protein product [Effrenium voratum]
MCCEGICNFIGSNRGLQILLALSSVLLGLLCGLNLISIVLLNHDTTGEPNFEFYKGTTFAAYYTGIPAVLLWWVALISRCCAPCCCTMKDVQCPCPCTRFHLLDVPFYVGMYLCLYPIGLWYSIETAEVPEFYDYDADVWYDSGLWQFLEIVQLLGVLLLFLAFPLGIWKFLMMKTPAPAAAAPVIQAQVVGTAVAVNTSNENDTNNMA